MRTPDEIKKGLECCRKAVDTLECPQECPYYKVDCDCGSLPYQDCVAYIQQLETKCHQLEADNAELFGKIERLEAERDAAVRDCGCFPCQTCEERENGDFCPMCEVSGGYRTFHQWRGVQKDG